MMGSEGMRHMLSVGVFFNVLGSRHCNRTEPSSLYVAYTKHVTFGWLALLDVLVAGSK